MHVAFALFADAANLSQEGKLNILGVFDAVQVMDTPAMHPRAHLVVRVKAGVGDVGRHRLALRWIGPNQDELWGSDGELEVGPLPPGSAEIDVPVIASLDLPLPLPGTYAMLIAVDGTPATEVTLDVHTSARMVPRPSGLVS